VIAAKDFTVAGQVPASTTISLVGGTWNFVGYASFTPMTATLSFTGITVSRLEGYSPAPQYYLQAIPMTTVLTAGQGYWVNTPTGGSWTVTN